MKCCTVLPAIVLLVQGAAPNGQAFEEMAEAERAFAGEALYAETAKSADLGYTWGAWQGGHYTRVWVRDSSGGWKVVLDLDAPARRQGS